MKSKAKGSRRERQARDILRGEGFAVTKAAGSFGPWDLVAIREFRDAQWHVAEMYLPLVRLIQVKSNQWPRAREMDLLRASRERQFTAWVSCEIWRFDDRAQEPRIRVL